MSCTTLPWRDAIYALRAAHPSANPNASFQQQLRHFFDSGQCEEERERLWLLYPEAKAQDDSIARRLQARQWHFILHGTLPPDDSDGVESYDDISDESSMSASMHPPAAKDFTSSPSDFELPVGALSSRAMVVASAVAPSESSLPSWKLKEAVDVGGEAGRHRKVA